jgi:hypothetical protein
MKYLLIYFAILFPLVTTPVKAVTTVKASLVGVHYTGSWTPPSPDPAGITFIPVQNKFLISDCEVDEMPIYVGVNLFYSETNGNLSQSVSSISNEPTGLSYDPQSDTLYISDDDSQRIYKGKLGSNQFTYFRTSTFGSTDPESVAVGGNNDLWIAGGADHKVFHTSVSGNLLSSFDTSVNNLNDLEGVAYNPANNTLLVLSLSPMRIGEYTPDGVLTRYIDLPSGQFTAAADLVIAPSSSTADSPDQKNLFVVDRGIDNNEQASENDGKIVELSVPSQGPLTGDINQDGIVNILDFTLLSNAFGAANSSADLNKDGMVNILDFTLLSNNFGKTLQL